MQTRRVKTHSPDAAAKDAETSKKATTSAVAVSRIPAWAKEEKSPPMVLFPAIDLTVQQQAPKADGVHPDDEQNKHLKDQDGDQRDESAEQDGQEKSSSTQPLLPVNGLKTSSSRPSVSSQSPELNHTTQPGQSFLPLPISISSTPTPTKPETSIMPLPSGTALQPSVDTQQLSKNAPGVPEKQPVTARDNTEPVLESPPSVESVKQTAEKGPQVETGAEAKNLPEKVTEIEAAPTALAEASTRVEPKKGIPEKARPVVSAEQPQTGTPGGVPLPKGFGSPSGGSEPSAPAKPSVDVSSTEGLLQSLSTVPASSFNQATSMASEALPQIQVQEKFDLEASFPKIERPTGLPSQVEEKKAAPTVLTSDKAPELGEGINAGKEKGTEAPDVTVQAHGPVPGSRVATTANEPKDEENGSWWSWLTNRVSNFLRAIPTSDPGLSTSAGTRPQVELTGKANPNRNKEPQAASDQVVARQQMQADQAVEADFGENNIYPTVSPETLSPSYTVSAPPTSNKPEEGEATAVPTMAKDVRMAFDKNAQPWLEGKVNEQFDQYRQNHTNYQKQSEETRAEGQRRIDQETEQVRAQQEALQKEARGEVDTRRKEWHEDNRKIQQDYATQSETKQKEVDKQIQQQVQTASQKVDKTLTDAEKQADEERKKTEAQAAEKKREDEKKPRSFWERAKGAISTVFETLKKAYDLLYEGLRWLVKKIIEGAKLVARGIIEVARMAVVGIIEGYGIFLKGLVSVALVMYPEKAAKARAWIDDKVNKAVKIVNSLAEDLKKATDAILDWVGKTLDTALSFLQKLTGMALEVLRLLATGQIGELLTKIDNMGKALWESRHYIEGAFWEELIGFDISKPIAPQGAPGVAGEATGTEGQATGETEQAGGDPDNTAFLMQETIRNDQVVVDPVPQLEMDEELLESLTLEEGETKKLGEANDPQRGTLAIQTDLLAKLPQEPLPTSQEEAEEQAEQQDPETQAIKERLLKAKDRTERLAVVKDLVLDGIKKYWEKKLKPNLWWIIPSLILALAAFIALEILTGGAITAALPIIMEVLAALFLAQDIARVMEGLNEYLENGWAGKIELAARGFAKAVARGGVALLMFFLFEYGGKALKAAFKGLARLGKATGRAIVAVGKAAVKVAAAVGRGLVKGILYIGKLAVKAIHIVAELFPRTGGFILKKGKLIFEGLKSGFAKGVKKVEELFQKLMSRFPKFKGFEAERHRDLITVYAVFNARIPVWSTQTGVTSKNAKILRDKMEERGIKFGPNDRAHHLVASTAEAAEPAQKILGKYKIDINAPENGLKLHKDIHGPLHTNRYYDRVNTLLADAKSKKDVLDTLKKISREIKAGKLP